MATWSEMGAGAKTAAVAVVAVILGSGGYELWQALQRPVPSVAVPATDAAPAATDVTTAPAADVAAPAADVAAVPAADNAAVPNAPAAATDGTAAPSTNAVASTDAVTAPVTEAAVGPAPAADASVGAPATDMAAAPAAPSFDLVRIDPDGSAVIAGQAARGAHVTLMVDGAVAATVLPDGSGKFVAMFNLPASAAGRVLTMVATMPDGTVMASPTSVALAATAPLATTTAPVATTTAPVAAAAGTATADASNTAPAAATAEAPADLATADVTSGGTTALAVTDQGVKVLQTGTEVPADVAANVVLQTIAYPSATDVQFAGHGTPGGFVRLYLDNAPLGDAAPVGADGSWSVSLRGIEPGIYTLRVDQVDAGGKVTSRFETPFKREVPEALAAANGVEAPAAAPADTPIAATEAPAKDAAAAVGEATVAPDATAATTKTAGTALTAGDTTAAATADAGTTAAAESAVPAAKADVAAAATATAAADPGAAETAAPAAKADVTAAATATVAAAPTTATAETGMAAADATASTTVIAATTAVTAATSAAKPSPVTITVQPGYTLWGIAKANMGSGVLYVQVFDANRTKIKNPDLIYPGQVFTMPTAN